MATQYLRKKSDGTWEYSTEKPTDPYEPVITKEQVEAEMGTPTPPGRTAELAEEWLREQDAPRQPEGGAEIDPSRRHVGLTFGERPGPSLGEGTRVHFAGKYSPYDERRIQKLYEQRSQIATDPELTEDERQGALDQVDQQMSQIPPLPPTMQEPTAQETFEQSIVTAPDGQQGTIDKSGVFRPIETGKAAAEDQKAYQERYGELLEGLSKTEEAKEEKDRRPYADIREQAKMIADDQFGRMQMPEEQLRDRGYLSELEPIWKTLLAEMEDKYFGRASEKQMLAELAEYIRRAVEIGISPEQASADFLQRWKAAAESTSYFGDDIVAPMSARWKRKARYAPYLSPAAPAVPAKGAGIEPFAAVGGEEVPVGGGPRGSVTVGGKTVRTGQVIVQDKKGKKYFLPANELEAALAQGYKLVE